MSLDETADYLRKADECRRNAEGAGDSVAKSHWLEAADDWLFQAETVLQKQPQEPGA
jgi:hypothetical protein